LWRGALGASEGEVQGNSEQVETIPGPNQRVGIQAQECGLDVGCLQWCRIREMLHERGGHGHEGLAISFELQIPLVLCMEHRCDVELLDHRRQLLVLL